MTEYITIKPESTDDPEVIRLMTNLDLTAGGPPERYLSPEQGDNGSPLAQAIFAVPGVVELWLDSREARIRRATDVEWHDVIEDVTDTLKDFFL